MRYLFLILALLSTPAFAQKVYFSTPTEVTATTVSALAVALNNSRNYLLIQNKGAVGVYVSFGAVSTGTDGVYIVAGGNYEPLAVPLNGVYVRSASATSAVVIVEGQ